MIENPPYGISILFGLTVLLTLLWFYRASKSRLFLIIASGWILLQSILGYSGFYHHTESIPPRLLLFGVFPAIIFSLLMLLTMRGMAWVNAVDMKVLTYFHTIRIPVEIVLALLYHQGLVSVYMTYEGTNFDLFSGITAPIIAFLVFGGRVMRKKLLMWWNLICLLLLANVVVTAVFALPSPFQKLAFDQPNVAVLYFPFNLLPTFVVPLVLFAHLIAFRRLAGIRP